MSERLTDEDLAGLERIIVGDDGVRPIMFPWMDRAIAELRERRAADLTAEEREALAQLRRDVEMEGCSNANCDSCHRHRHALAVLAKLTREGGE